MKHLRLVGVALIVICSLGAVTASAASAIPSLTYSGNGKFTIGSGDGALETTFGASMNCAGDTGTGQLGASPARTAELTVTFVNCEFLGRTCTSLGQTIGNVQTTKLKLTFGALSGTQDGTLLRAASGTALLVPSTKCSTSTVTVEGSVIGSLSPLVGVQTASLNDVFVQSKGIQADSSFIGESTTNFLVASFGAPPERSGLASEEKLSLVSGSGQLTH
jgi:hypothetical protein